MAVALTSVALATGAFGTVATPAASAASNAVPGYEVKFNLVAAALDGSGTPSAEVRSVFGLDPTPGLLSYEYFDTPTLDLKKAGWSVRFRHKGGKKFDLNYKKRFPVTNGDINGALTVANSQGFDSDSNDKCEVDWTSDSQVLSFGDKRKASAEGYADTDLPDESDARAILLDNLADKLENWSSSRWGRDKLEASRAYGPVTAAEWEGSWQGTGVAIEVLPVRAASGSGMETVIELSFRADTLDSATALRNQVRSTLQAKGWLSPTSVLKTDLILSRY